MLFGTNATIHGRHGDVTLRTYAVRKPISSFMKDVSDGMLSILVLLVAHLSSDAAIAL